MYAEGPKIECVRSAQRYQEKTQTPQRSPNHARRTHLVNAPRAEVRNAKRAVSRSCSSHCGNTAQITRLLLRQIEPNWSANRCRRGLSRWDVIYSAGHHGKVERKFPILSSNPSGPKNNTGEPRMSVSRLAPEVEKVESGFALTCHGGRLYMTFTAQPCPAPGWRNSLALIWARDRRRDLRQCYPKWDEQGRERPLGLYGLPGRGAFARCSPGAWFGIVGVESLL